MIDHIIGRPNPSWKRAQVLTIIIFWIWRIVRGNTASQVLWLRRLNTTLKRFTPYQIILSTLTAVYALRNLDTILGFTAPEPLARLYSSSFYRATWINTGLDAGFATAMPIRPRWLRDICSLVFSVYYIICANSAEEQLRRFRAVPTVEMLRATWEKTTNPYLRLFSHIPSVPVRRKLSIPRPKSSSYADPTTAYLFFSLPENQLCNATELILDFPGGGFVAMTPEHHEERLAIWAQVTRRPVLSIDYGKAPEYPYPFAIDEAYDVYKTLVDSVGRCIGMSGKSLRIIVSGDSAGAVLAVNIVNRILEHRNNFRSRGDDAQFPLPVSLVLNYAALDFNFTSWMSAENLHVLQYEQSSGNLPGLAELALQKDHLQHVSPLSMVRDQRPRGNQLQRRRSWKEALRAFAGGTEKNPEASIMKVPKLQHRRSTGLLRTALFDAQGLRNALDGSFSTNAESDEDDFRQWKEEDRPIQARVLYSYDSSTPPARDLKAEQVGETDKCSKDHSAAKTSPKTAHRPETGRIKGTIGTRLTMTSRTGYFQDRIISPSMMRAMAIMYIGPHRNPDFKTDYRISPILTPSHLLAQYPPLLMQCGERDPFVDDTVIFAGRIREAKRARKIELELMISGKSARFGEGLRMTRSDSLDPNALADLKQEQEKLSGESEEDWVQMDLFSDWSHGYLQMGTLMSEARAVIKELAVWIDDSFVRSATPSAVYCNGHGVEKVGRQTGSNLMKQARAEYPPAPSPPASASETEAEVEAEDEPGITFVTRKYQDESRRMSFDMPVRGYHAMMLTSSGPDGTSFASTGSDKDRNKTERLENGDHRQQGPIPEVPKPATPRQAGQTISETELMRRRRLLDSHIFEQEKKV
ncbi:Alpha/Beta hydrolase protein [Amanita rubescens]|nr:Alpha/Beta hydrolase protein [Amanita rubescens]